MTEQEFCQDCNQKNQCQEVYRRLGSTKSPSVVFKVVVAFLLPLMVFIVALGVFETILAKAINTKELQTALACLLALSTTAVFIFIIRAKQPPVKAGAK